MIYNYERANFKNELRDYQGAIDYYTKSIEMNSYDFVVYENRASAKRKLGDNKGADEDNKKADKLKKCCKKFYNNSTIGG